MYKLSNIKRNLSPALPPAIGPTPSLKDDSVGLHPTSIPALDCLSEFSPPPSPAEAAAGGASGYSSALAQGVPPIKASPWWLRRKVQIFGLFFLAALCSVSLASSLSFHAAGSVIESDQVGTSLYAGML